MKKLSFFFFSSLEMAVLQFDSITHVCILMAYIECFVRDLDVRFEVALIISVLDLSESA